MKQGSLRYQQAQNISASWGEGGVQKPQNGYLKFHLYSTAFPSVGTAVNGQANHDM